MWRRGRSALATSHGTRRSSGWPKMASPSCWRRARQPSRMCERLLLWPSGAQRRAVRTTRAVRAGERLAADDLAVLRPCPPDALPPYRLGEVLGRLARVDIDAGDCVRPADVD